MTSNRHSSSSGSGSDGDTKSRIIAVAERMIAERGAQQFSIRDITGGAGVNLAAINYHFGSKERLIAEVLARRITALNGERLVALDKLEAGAKVSGGPVGVEDILAVLFGDEAQRARNAHTMKMLNRLALDPDKEVVRMFKPHVQPFKERVVCMLSRTLPHLRRDEIEWRMNQVFGLVGHHMLFQELRCKDLGKKYDMKKEHRRLIAFCVAGLRAPSETPAKNPKS